MVNKHLELQKRTPEEELEFKNLFQEYFASMCVFADHYLDDFEAAKDTVHDVFFDIWENQAGWEGVTNVKAYLYTMVRNRCLNVLQRRLIHRRYEEKNKLEEKESETFYEHETLREDLYRMLEQSIRLLPEQSQKILLLKLRGLKNHEIAEELNISVNTVNTLKAHAYKILRTMLKDKYLILWKLIFLLKHHPFQKFHF